MFSKFYLILFRLTEKTICTTNSSINTNHDLYCRSVVQAWYECEDCGYSCHHKCLASIIRECAHVIATEKGTYEFEICPEVGLSAQRYLCAECNTLLPVSK